MNWYKRQDNGKPLCYPCAMERLRTMLAAHEIPLTFYPTARTVRCSDCRMSFVREGDVYVPKYGKFKVTP